MEGNLTTTALVLIGVSGCGKSTIGRLLAPTLNAAFLEGDDYHSAANVAKMRAGHPLTDADRWPWLDVLGHAIAERLAQGPVVVACSALRRAYRDALADAARRPLTFVHLGIDPATLQARLEGRHAHFMPVSLLKSQLATLEPLAPDEDGIEILETSTVDETVKAIQDWLADRHEKGRQRRP